MNKKNSSVGTRNVTPDKDILLVRRKTLVAALWVKPDIPKPLHLTLIADWTGPDPVTSYSTGSCSTSVYIN